MKWIVALTAALAVAQPTPKDKLTALGNALAAEVRRESQPFANDEVDAYVRRTVARLPAPVRVELVSRKSCEPIGLPGGIVLVPAEFLLAVEDEAEFVGMLAHAMAHATLPHGFLSLPNTSGIPLIFAGGWNGVHDQANDRMLIPVAARPTLRAHELEADQWAAAAAVRAGYDRAGLTRYLRRVSRDEERLAALDQAGEGEVLSSEFVRVREIVRGAFAEPVRKAPSLRGR